MAHLVSEVWTGVWTEVSKSGQGLQDCPEKSGEGVPRGPPPRSRVPLKVFWGTSRLLILGANGDKLYQVLGT